MPRYGPGWPKPWYQVTASWGVSVGIGLFFIVLSIGGIAVGPTQPTFYFAVLIALPGLFFLICAVLQFLAHRREGGNAPSED